MNAANYYDSKPPIGEPLWIDESILAFSKPGGLLTIRDGFRPHLPFLAQIVAQNFGPIWVVHRLDRDTSGIVLFARSAEIHRRLNQQFQDRAVKKLYRAIVHRLPSWDDVRADFHLRVNGDRMHRTVIDAERGKPAGTTLHVLQRFETGWALLAAEPHTGYTHQIRAHAAWLGHPIANDPLYRIPGHSPFAPDQNFRPGGGPTGIDRLALHAAAIEFYHPDVGRQVEIHAPDPPDLAAALEFLKTDKKE